MSFNLLIILFSFLELGLTTSKFIDIANLPIFIKSELEPHLFLRINNSQWITSFTHREIRYNLSKTDNTYLCTIVVTIGFYRQFLTIVPNLNGKRSFKCLILEKKIELDDKGLILINGSNTDLDTFINLLSMCYKKSDHNNFVKRFSLLDKILILTEKLKFNFIIMNLVWKIILKNCKELVNFNTIKREIITNHLNLRTIEANNNDFIKIQNNIEIQFSLNIRQSLLVGNFKSAKIFVSKYYPFAFHDFLMILQKESKKYELSYVVKFIVTNSENEYECYKKYDLNQMWDKNFCDRSNYSFNESAYVECKCKGEGFVTIVQEKKLKDFQTTKLDKLQDYWGFYFPWDFMDDKMKYLKEDEMRYLPFISAMRLIIVGVCTLNLLVYNYIGVELCLKNKRIFFAKETISVVIFLICLSISNLGFHILAYIGLVWKRKYLESWCSLVTFFHLNYVLSLCTFQCYIFIVAISKHNRWLHNICLPILLLGSPVAAGVIDGTATLWINKGCSLRVFNLSQNITMLFIVLPCAISTLLVPVMAVCTYSIIHKGSRLYGFIGTFFFSGIHLLGGVFLLLTNVGENTELQFYFQFCIASIIESLFQSLLCVFLLILCNTNTSLMDKHCTHDLDTKALKQYFEEPKSAIQLMGNIH